MPWTPRGDEKVEMAREAVSFGQKSVDLAADIGYIQYSQA